MNEGGMLNIRKSEKKIRLGMWNESVIYNINIYVARNICPGEMLHAHPYVKRKAHPYVHEVHVMPLDTYTPSRDFHK